MDDLPPQFVYKVLSYLPPKNIFLFECLSKKIKQKLVKNPYFLSKITKQEEIDYVVLTKFIKDRENIPVINGYKIPKEYVPMIFDKQVMKCTNHTAVTRFLMPECCEWAYCCFTCHNDLKGDGH